MKLGIVGSEAAKFTPETRRKARAEIQRLLAEYAPTLVVSGHSPLGGIDIWAVQEAQRAGIPVVEYPPACRSWQDGYRPRNLQIAEASDVVVCITLKRLPDGFRGMRFERGCYHCGTPPEDHVKSGGCWTMKQANRLGKSSELLVIQ